MDPKDVLTTTLSAVTASIAFYNWRSSRRRTKLKDDLDILKKYREEFSRASTADHLDNDPRITQLRARIQSRMRTQYVLKGVDHSDLTAGLALIVIGLGTLGATIFPQGLEKTEVWVIALAATSSVIGLMFLLAAFKDRNEEQGAR